MKKRKYANVGGRTSQKILSRCSQNLPECSTESALGKQPYKVSPQMQNDSADLCRDGAEELLEDYDEDLKPNRDRAFSRQTVYLVHKWLAEGIPLPMVARILNRSEENVRAAARIPLRKGEKALIRRYFSPFRIRKNNH